MNIFNISDDSLQKYKEAFEKDGIKYDSDEKYREAAQNLLSYMDTLIEIDMAERVRKARLEKEPKGFLMAGEGRSCSLCDRSVYEDGWYDKWGFKCMNCQDAIKKRNIPGSLCGDWKHEKYMTDSTFSWETKIHVQTVRKLIREGKIIARRIPHGPYLILRKDNPNIHSVIDENTKS